jgi:hypothetical protein
MLIKVTTSAYNYLITVEIIIYFNAKKVDAGMAEAVEKSIKLAVFMVLLPL